MDASAAGLNTSPTPRSSFRASESDGSGEKEGVSSTLINRKKNLILPWNTDGKLCKDRFRLLLKKWDTEDRAAASTSRGARS